MAGMFFHPVCNPIAHRRGNNRHDIGCRLLTYASLFHSFIQDSRTGVAFPGTVGSFSPLFVGRKGVLPAVCNRQDAGRVPGKINPNLTNSQRKRIMIHVHIGGIKMNHAATSKDALLHAGLRLVSEKGLQALICARFQKRAASPWDVCIIIFPRRPI